MSFGSMPWQAGILHIKQHRVALEKEAAHLQLPADLQKQWHNMLIIKSCSYGSGERVLNHLWFVHISNSDRSKKWFTVVSLLETNAKLLWYQDTWTSVRFNSANCIKILINAANFPYVKFS